MGQKVNPISNRLGVIRGWDSNWSEKGKYPDNILEDYKLREYLNVRLAKCSCVRVSSSNARSNLSQSPYAPPVPA